MTKYYFIFFLIFGLTSCSISKKYEEYKSKLLLRKITREYIESTPIEQLNFMFGNSDIKIEYVDSIPKVSIKQQ